MMIESVATIPLVYLGWPIHGSPVRVFWRRPMPAVLGEPCRRSSVMPIVCQPGDRGEDGGSYLTRLDAKATHLLRGPSPPAPATRTPRSVCGMALSGGSDPFFRQEAAVPHGRLCGLGRWREKPPSLSFTPQTTAIELICSIAGMPCPSLLIRQNDLRRGKLNIISSLEATAQSSGCLHRRGTTWAEKVGQRGR